MELDSDVQPIAQNALFCNVMTEFNMAQYKDFGITIYLGLNENRFGGIGTSLHFKVISQWETSNKAKENYNYNNNNVQLTVEASPCFFFHLVETPIAVASDWINWLIYAPPTLYWNKDSCFSFTLFFFCYKEREI